MKRLILVLVILGIGCGVGLSIRRTHTVTKVKEHTVTRTVHVPGPTKTVTKTVTKGLPDACRRLANLQSQMVGYTMKASDLADRLHQLEEQSSSVSVQEQRASVVDQLETLSINNQDLVIQIKTEGAACKSATK